MGPVRALVRPRGRLTPFGASLPLESLLLRVLDAERKGLIYILAPAGAGKTTALEYLRAKVGRDDVTYLDEPAGDYWEIQANAATPLVVVATNHRDQPNSLATLHLAEWGEDDWIEYLVANHRDRVTSVMDRVLKDEDRGTLLGKPELWTIVLDEMAEDGAVRSCVEALRVHLGRRMSMGPTRLELSRLCFLAARDSIVVPPSQIGEDVRRLVRHPIVQQILAADYLAERLCDRQEEGDLIRPLPRVLIREVGRLLRDRPAAVRRIEQLVAGKSDKSDAMAVSILSAMDPKKQPEFRRVANLRNAQLEDVGWGAVVLPQVNLTLAKCARAWLAGADLPNAILGAADFTSADLSNANLRAVRAYEAHFDNADLSRADASEGYFPGAKFVRAAMEGTQMVRANLRHAVLQKAYLHHAILREADLTEADLDAADLSLADLTGALLNHVDLRNVTCTHSLFAKAKLIQCNLEELELDEPSFEGANLQSSYLTGSRFRNANFRNANLRNTGLADVNWSGADLRDADLRRCSFHLGSTRSGLVGSVIPCEGSRTGFYTDDYGEQDYKAPEEIRKANLTNADLRGANIEGVDFYLVDLRNAKYTEDQAKQLRRTGAILRSRVA